LVAGFKAALIRLKNDTADIVVPSIDEYICDCDIFAVVEAVDVHRIVDLLLGSVATSAKWHTALMGFTL
jgi:hypothetical protein